MGYPNPLTVRTVKQVLKDGMYEAGLYGAASVVDALVGTFWGSLFTRSNRRDYLNFLGELAGRTITGQQAKIASAVVSDHFMVSGNDGKPVIRLPAQYDGSRYYNKDGGERQVNRGYDPLPYDRRESVVPGALNMKGNRYNKGGGGQSQQSQKPKNKGNNNNKQVQKNMSVLEDAVFDLSSKMVDFSITSFFQKVKDKLLSLVNRSPDKKQTGKDVLQGCYEFLEEQGQDGYSILVNILTSNARNFSEGELDEQFKDSLKLYASLTDSQKEAFLNALQVACGKEQAQLALSSLQKGKDGVVIPRSVIRILKILGILTITLGILRTIFTPPKKDNLVPV